MTIMPDSPPSPEQLSLMDQILDATIGEVVDSQLFPPAAIADLRRLRDTGSLKKVPELLRIVRASPEVKK